MGSLGDFVKNASQAAQGIAGAVKSTAEAGAAGLNAGGIVTGAKAAVNTGSDILKNAAANSPRIGKVFACGEKIASKASSVINSKSFSPKFLTGATKALSKINGEAFKKVMTKPGQLYDEAINAAKPLAEKTMKEAADPAYKGIRQGFNMLLIKSKGHTR